SLSGGADQIRGVDTGAHQRAVFSVALSNDVDLGPVSLHPALRLDAVGAQTGASPALAALWKPLSSTPLELRAGWGLSFRPPSFSELYLDRGGIAPNPDLQPEHAWSIDAGAAWRGPSLTISAGA